MIKCKLEGFHAEYERISRHNDQLNDQRTLLNVKCQIKKLALDAYIKVENIFYEKIDKLERFDLCYNKNIIFLLINLIN